MIKSWSLKLCLPVTSAAVLVGCSTEQNRAATDLTTSQTTQNQQVTVSGCLGTGIGSDQLMLWEVQLAPLGQQPSTGPLTTGSPLTPHAQVRLAMKDRDQLERLVGQKVTVTGAVSNDGRNTIGTSGAGQTPAQGQVESRDDKSQAATKQHHSQKVAEEAGPMGKQSMNNGTFPEITVASIRGSGEKCTVGPVHQRR